MHFLLFEVDFAAALFYLIDVRHLRHNFVQKNYLATEIAHFGLDRLSAVFYPRYQVNLAFVQPGPLVEK
jgi:hypothetical protein